MALLSMPPALEYYMRGLFFNYRRSHRIYKNEYFCNAEWNAVEVWYLAIQLRAKLLDWDFNLYYDGNTVSQFTILGVCFIKGYTTYADQISGEIISTPRPEVNKA